MTGRWLAGPPWDARPLAVVVPPGSAGPELLSGWPAALPGADVALVQVPGRGARLFETPVPSIVDLADALACHLTDLVPERWVLAGHCSGSHLALEVAHRMVAAGRPPLRLVVSGSRPPHGLADPESAESKAAAELLSLNDRELSGRLGLDQSTVDDDVAAAMLAAYRAAVEAAAAHRHRHGPLGVAVEVWRGEDDDVFGEQDAHGWSGYATTEPVHAVFTGRREYFEQPRSATVDRVARALDVARGTR
ncbi:thioesterase II family protein [Amycolatopsis sp. cmx-4-54]|uniref:thioesterase II family protein n=1 Tax=Amycolatopsis sp. cmx-4-54 TaxID=2790936 RepID=UPI00397BD27C